MARQLNIAVVGSGIAGLSAAWLLSGRHRVTLYERLARPGGHSNTVDVTLDEGHIPVDTGFIVYNTATYPNLIALFDHLGVATAPTKMSFAVSLNDGRYEYKGSGMGLFAQPANLFRMRHWSMIRDVLRFFREAEADAAEGGLDGVSLGDYLRSRGYGAPFIDDHIVPMGAAIWSTPDADLLAYPADSFIRFFANHGLLQARSRPEWRTVVGGSREYVALLLKRLEGRVRLSSGVRSILRTASGVRVAAMDGSSADFDHVVIASHADEALAMLGDADPLERELLGAFRYTENEAILHGDAGLMPRRRRAWASWNYLSGADRTDLMVTYWMNSLQPLATKRPIFVTLNGGDAIEPAEVYGRYHYTHPLYDARAIAAQPRLWSLQGRRRTWFAGSYFGHGFHEDALQAGLAVAEQLGDVRRPWTVADESGRICAGDMRWTEAEAAQ